VGLWDREEAFVVEGVHHLFREVAMRRKRAMAGRGSGTVANV
jgi:hypothetical protein